ncbi:hypothetical protein AB0L41_42095 [Amycolatopsis mediterranei]|uniref:hypothetical protein n=1 Tax=Amycolatopsis mediterranei TaxID=33910 RepID=UPI0034201FF1
MLGLDLPGWRALFEPVTARAGLPAGSLTDDRVWTRTMSEEVGEALLGADRDDLKLPSDL